MEKIKTKDYNNQLESKESLSKVKAIDASGNDILVSAKTVASSGGCGAFWTDIFKENKWYRIAISRPGASMSTVLLNVGSRYYNQAPCSQLFYIASAAYSAQNNVIELGAADQCIGKIRLLYRSSEVNTGMLDVYVKARLLNAIDFAYSCNIGFTFQTPVEVPEEPDAGYSVKEFTF